MRHASLKYPDAWLGSVMSADAKELTPALSLLLALGLNTDSHSASFLDMVLFFMVLLVLQMSYRVVQHSDGKGIVRGNSEMYLGA
eukprot:7457361-Pyramimonas_sp.AAC.1